MFVHEVLPILEAKCMVCHGDDPAELDGGLDLSSREGLARGGEQYADLIVDGRPEMSPLYLAITREQPDLIMPPRQRDALSTEEIHSIYNWIVDGAKWPSAEEIKRINAASNHASSRQQVPTSAGETETWSKRYYRTQNLWAYQPLQRPSIPNSTIHPIDAFINRSLKRNQIKSAGPADPQALIRRLHFDVTGLPPSADLVRDFAQHHSIKYEDLVDQLLASEHYGEQWATHWLDVVRYADSDGFSNDYARPSAWRYRDYVVRSFNDDLPYNKFVFEQIAGDELDPQDGNKLIATGFLRMGPWEHTGMAVAAETRQYFLDDVTNIVGETFLATPLNCAKCHDHKYDPIPTRDYYQIQSVFATTQFAERPADFLPEENQAFMKEERARVEQWLERITHEKDSLRSLEEEAAKRWYQQRGLAYLPKKERRRSDRLDRHPPRYHGLTFADLGYRKVLDKRGQIERRNLERFEPWAYSVYNGPLRPVHSNRKMRMPAAIQNEPSLSYVLKGGSVYAPTDTVWPGVLSVLHYDTATSQDFNESARITAAQRGRRSDFALWLVHPENPLTARVMVNRIWQHHFGTGLAENPNNFGATGRAPTHPELLDWLAGEFIDHNWSVKHLDRLILTSATYQRAAEHPNYARIRKVDPDNRLLSHFSPRRLRAEEIRDAMLQSTGELQTQLGGIPSRPEIPLEVALQPRHTMGSVAPAYQPSSRPEMRNRRSLYIERKRAIKNPMMQVFNQSDNDLSCEQRDESTVVTQAFTLLNSSEIRNRSMVFAHRLLQDHTDQLEAIREAYLRVFQRLPTQKEILEADTFIKQLVQDYQQIDFATPVYPKMVVRDMVEEMTGEAFVFTEYLDVYDNYSSDLDEVQVTPKIRAWADYISVLFNTNEFLYVY